MGGQLFQSKVKSHGPPPPPPPPPGSGGGGGDSVVNESDAHVLPAGLPSGLVAQAVTVYVVPGLKLLLLQLIEYGVVLGVLEVGQVCESPAGVIVHSVILPFLGSTCPEQLPLVWPPG